MSIRTEPKGKILIIDDTVSIINMVKAALLGENYQILMATSGINGIKSAEKAKPDLILLDILMPEMDGYETCIKLKANKATEHIPIIFMSALSEVFDKIKAFNLGAVDYITKPLNVEELIARVSTQVKLYKLQEQLKNTNELLEQKVEERTKELKYKYDELQAAEEELKASNDALKENFDKLFKSERKLQLSEKLLKESQSVGKVASWEYNFVKNKLTWSDEVYRMLGLEPNTFEPNIENYIDYIHPDDREIVNKAYQKSVEDKTPYKVEHRFINQNTKETIVVKEIGQNIYDEKGNAIKSIGMTIDITEQKKYELHLKEKHEELQAVEEELRATNDELRNHIYKLRENEIKLNAAQKLAKLGHYNLSFNLGIWSSSVELNAIFGIDETYHKDIDGWLNIVHPDFKQTLYNYFSNEVVAKKKSFNKEYKIINLKTKQELWVHGLGELTFDNEGNLQNMLGSIQDITERKLIALEKEKATVELQHERDLLHSLMSNIPDTIYFKDTESKFTRINKAQAKLLGLDSPSEAIGKTDFDFFAKQHAENAFNDEQNIVKTGQPCINKHEAIINRNGKIRYVSTTKVPVKDKNGKVISIVGVTRDITKQKEIEKQLIDSESLLKESQKVGRVGSWEYNIAESSLKWSDEVYHIFGYDLNEIEPNYDIFLKSIYQDDQDKVHRAYIDSINNKDDGYEVEHRVINKKTKELTYVVEKCRHIKNNEGEIVRSIGLVSDITKQKFAQETVRKTNKALENIIKASSSISGQSYFKAMVRILEEISGASYSFIGEYIGKHAVKTIALLKNGKIIKNITYELLHTPCANVLDNETCFYPKNITQIFPKDQLLVDLGIEAYVGSPVFNHKKECLGIVVSLYEKPINDAEFDKSIYEIFASKIGAEMERLNVEKALIEKNEELRAAEEELIATNDELRTSMQLITDRENAISKIVNNTMGKSGNEFFNQMALVMNKVTNSEYTFIGELTTENSVKTLALVQKNKILENFEYSLVGTPCDTVLTQDTCIYTNGVCTLFPDDQLLVDLKVDAYIGTSIRNKENNRIGIIASMYTSDIKESSFMKSLFEMFASKIGAEMERLNADRALIEKNQELQAAEEELITSNHELRNNINLLHISEQKLNEAQSTAHIGHWDWDVNTGTLNWSDEIFNIFGVNHSDFEVSSENFEKTIHPDDLNNFIVQREKGLNSKKEFSIDHRIIRPSGEIRYVQERTKTVFEGKKLILVFGTVQDITEIKLAELELIEKNEALQATEEELLASNDALKDNLEKLSESETRFKALHNASFGGIAIHDMGTILETNQGMEEITGYTYNELIGMNGLELISKTMRDLVLENIKNKYEKPYEAEGVRKDGSTYPLRLEGRQIPYRGKQVRVVEFRDISDQKEADLKLKQSEEKFRTLAENTPGVIYLCNNDENYSFAYLNNEVLKLTGYKKEEFYSGKISLTELYHSDDDAMIRSEVDKALKNKSPFRIEYKLRTKSGKWRWIEEYGAGIFDGDKLQFIEGSLMDITDRKNTQMIERSRFKISEYATLHSANELLTFTLDEIEKLTDSKIGFYHFVKEDEETIDLHAWSTNTTNTMCKANTERAHYPISQAGVWVDCIHQRKAIIHNDYSKLTHKKGLPDGHAPIIRELVVPVVRNKKIVAVLGVGNKDENYTNEDVKIVEKLADVAFETVLRKKAEEHILEERNRTINIIEGTNAGTWEWIPNQDELIINERWAEMIGYKLNEIKPTFDFWFNSIHVDDQALVDEKVQTHLQGKTEYYDTEFRMKHKNGSWVWINSKGKIIERNNKGDAIRMAGTHLDITEKKKAEEKLIKNEQQLQLVYDSSPAIMLLVNSKSEILSMNKTGLSFLDTDLEAIRRTQPGDAFKCIVAIQSGKGCGNSYACNSCEIRRNITKAIQSNELQKKEEAKLNIIKQGHIKKLTILISSNIAVHEPEPIYLITIDDITERKQNEIELKNSEHRFRSIIEAANDAIYIADAKTGHIVDVNRKGYELIGRTKEETVGMYQSKLHPENNTEESRSNFREDVNMLDNPIVREVKVQHKDGHIIPVEVSPALINLGGDSYLVGFFRDISKRKQAENALEESKDRFKQLADNATEGIIIHKKGEIVDVNKTLLKMSGYTESELLGKDIFKTFIPPKFNNIVYESMLHSNPPAYEIRALKKDGSSLPVEVKARNISKTNKTLRVISIRDISEQKQMQQKILQAIINTEEQERKRVAQELHDGLGPILSASKLYVETFLRSDSKAYKEKAQKNLLTGIEEALKQVSTISNNLSPHVLNDFGLEAAINKFIDRVMSLNAIHIEFTFASELEISNEIETSLYRITNELVNNTLKYAKAEHVFIHIFDSEGKINLLYKDDGIGFDFEKTKQEKGGMGLFNITNRIQTFNGTLNFEKPKGRGIIYEITIPIKDV